MPLLHLLQVGEAFRPLVPRWAVNASYGLAGAYVCSDAAWRAQATSREPAVEAVDTLLWQGLASIALPGLVINRVVWGAAKFAKPKSVVPTLVGLAVVPLIIRPIDAAVDKVMDETVRRLLP